MSKQRIMIVVLIIFAMIVVVFVNKKNSPLVAPVISPISSASPSTASYNPPKEVKYDSSADLKKELDSIDPQVLESDFE